MASEHQAILRELRGVGIDVDSIDRFHTVEWRRRGYREAIPVLIAWLSKTRHARMRVALAAGLATSDARPAAAGPLIRQIQTEENEEAREHLADAIGVTAGDAEIEDVIALARDPSLGVIRANLIPALARSKRPEAKNELVALMGEADAPPLVLVEGIKALASRREVNALPAVRRLLSHPSEQVRKAAERAEKALGQRAGPQPSSPPSLPIQGIPARQAETSINVDLERLPSLFREVAGVIDRGLGRAVVERITQTVADLDLDEEVSFDVDVEYAGQPARLRVVVFMDDLESPDVHFLGDDRLISAVDAQVGEFADTE